MSLVKTAKTVLYKSGLQRRLSCRRLKLIDSLAGGRILGNGSSPVRILDVGCADGKDFVKLVSGRKNLEIYGIDTADKGLRQENFSMIVGDAELLDFPDKHFDILLSIGVLEHVQPVEKLCRVISEINRVSKSYFVVVPAISTIIEPHTSSILWQMRGRGKKVAHNRLNYYSDDAWLKFDGFQSASLMRFFHIPPFVSNLLIYSLK